jgi:hypothetical protein
MKTLRTIGILALVAGLVLGGAGSAFAEGPPDPPGGGPHSPKHGLFGTVLSVTPITGGYVIELETEEGTFDITADDTTKYMAPTKTKGPVTLADFVTVGLDGDIANIVGRRLAVLAGDVVEVTPGEFTATAIRLMLIPSSDSPPSWVHRVGVVDTFTPYDPGPPTADGEILIVDKDDVDHTFTINEDTVYRPHDIDMGAITGGFVTVVTKGDPKLTPPLVAKAIVLHELPLPDWAP